jgi:nicotinamide-nucleotide amidase
MATKLNEIGVRVSRINTIADESEAIITTLEEVFQRVDLVLMTGGLGPTNDDLTKKTLSDYFGMELKINEEVLADITAYFTSRGKKMLQMNIDQALLPDGAYVLRNYKGTASGMWFERDGKSVVSMPGVPYEMEHLMETGVIPRIIEKYRTTPVFHHTLMTFGEGESFIAERIKDWEAGLSGSGVKLAYLPSPGIVKLRLSAFGQNKSELEETVMSKVNELEALIPELVYGHNDETMEMAVANLLKNRGMTIATAESCTGGYIAHLLTSIPGSSSYYEGSFCTYSYRSKTKILGVDSELIAVQGAVSGEVVEAMVKGVFTHFDTDYAIAVSGIAGPAGGTPEKPVGTVWMCVGTKENQVTQCFHFGRDRMRNIRMTALHALNLVRLSILDS